MAMAAITSGCTDNLPQRLSFDTNHLRAASFSPYLNCPDRTCGRKLGEKSANQNSTTTTAPHFHFGRKRVEDEEEIGVFGAEKYFNGGLDEVEEDPRVSKNGEISYRYLKDHYPVDTNPTKAKIQLGSPRNHSDSSWNSQSALLGNGLRNPLERKTNKRNGRSLLSALGVKCSCIINNKAADTNEQVGAIQEENFTKEPLQIDLAPANKSRLSPWVSREDCFTFPILNSRPGNSEFKARLQENNDDGHEDEEQRKTPEVFGGSPAPERKNNKSLALSLERKVTELTWDYSNARREEVEFPGSSDFESDASSDLFEIECFRNNINNNNNGSFLQRQASDGMSMSMSSCVTPTTCNAPSDASIEWSVVTASAADFSVISDSDQDLMMTSMTARHKPRKGGLNARSTLVKEVEKRRSAGTLLGCKSHKAVSVAGDAKRTNGKPVAGFQAGGRVKGKGGG